MSSPAFLFEPCRLGDVTLANPDLVQCLRRGGGAQGYTDYPTLGTAA
ncbi:hypothetical protein ACLBXM_17400 [Xanthobacteraceae bacterium A53D]